MANFYLKAVQTFEEKRDGKKGSRIVEYIQNPKFEGRVDDAIRKDCAIDYADFQARLKAFGVKKAEERCKKDGFFVPPSLPKPKPKPAETDPEDPPAGDNGEEPKKN